MSDINNKSKETTIVEYAMDIMVKNPKTTFKSLRKELSEIDALKDFNINFLAMKRATVEHYKYSAMMFNRLRKVLSEKVTGYDAWSENDFNMLLSTGIMLCEAAYHLLRIISDEKFLFELEKVVEYLKINRSQYNMKKFVTEDVKNRINKMEQSELKEQKHNIHNEIVNGLGKDILRKLGCKFVTSEAVLEKKDKDINQKGLRLDMYGWKDDTSVVGIEVKIKKSDYNIALRENRFERYLDYCTEFYIMTTENSIFELAKQWCSNHEGAGAILLDKKTLAKKVQEPRKLTERETTPQMIQKMLTVFASKMKKLIDTTCFEFVINTPSAARDQLLVNLSKEIEMNTSEKL